MLQNRIFLTKSLISATSCGQDDRKSPGGGTVVTDPTYQWGQSSLVAKPCVA